MPPIQSLTLHVTPLGSSNVGVIIPLRELGRTIPIQIPGEGTSAGLAITAGLGFGRNITAPGVQAEARIHLGPRSAGWKFGFIQFLRFQVLDVRYRGNRPEEGWIFAQYYPINEQQRILLDQAVGADSSQPWYHPNSVAEASLAVGGALTIPFNDTPSDFIECRRINRANGMWSDNWLHRLWCRFAFTTTLAAQSPSGRVEPLQSFDWMVDWNLSFTHSQGPDPNANWMWTPNPCRGKTVGRPSSRGLQNHPDIAALFAGPRFQMLPTVCSSEPRGREPTLRYFATW